MNEDINIEETIWDYLDGTMRPAARLTVDQLIANDAAWRTKYEELLEVHTLMRKSIELDEPSLRFTQNVMEEISRLYITPAAAKYINKHVIRGIGIFFLTTIAALVVYGFGETNFSQPSNIPGLNQLGGSNTFDWSRLYNNSFTNIFVMINIVLGLMLLDMYLDKRKKAHRPATI